MNLTELPRHAGALFIAGLVATLAGCGAGRATADPEAPQPAAASAAVENAVVKNASDSVEDLPPTVVAALEAAARGEAYGDDLNPGTAKTGKALTPVQQAFDVRHYGLSVRVMPETRSIEGRLEVTFQAVEPLSAIELDLDPDLTVHGADVAGVDAPVERDGDSFTVTLPAPVDAGGTATVTINYGGEPHIAMAPPWHGGFVWSEVDGTPWFATAVQTEGCDLWWPCKDTYADKPDDGVEVAITAPRGVKMASVGTLAGMEEGDYALQSPT